MSGGIVARAHGRVNLIGEHTDYNQGWVLPTAIPQFTEVRLDPRHDQDVHVRSGFSGQTPRMGQYRLGEEKRVRGWLDYIQGVTFVLRESGQAIQGFDLTVHSNIPEGSGLSSSAALEIALLKAIRDAHHLRLSDAEIARLAQRSENEFVGAKVGIMDQMACSFARAGEALYLDTRDLTFERIQIPSDALGLIVIHSGVSHVLSAPGEGYNLRRQQCEDAAHLLRVNSLREVGLRDLDRISELPPPLNRRARHVVTENERVHQAVDALRRWDFPRLGRLLTESHASLRDDYEVSISEVDRLVAIAEEQDGVFGARLTGAGFGGSIVAIAKAEAIVDIACRIHFIYSREVNQDALVLVPQMREHLGQRLTNSDPFKNTSPPPPS